MGLFKRKPDPISERAKLLNEQIAALETEIKKLGEAKEAPPTPSLRVTTSPFATPPPGPAPSQPRLRSTALPHAQMTAAAALPAPGLSVAPQEPVFEEVDQERIQSQTETGTAAHYNDLGVRKYDLASAWQRFKNHFRGPVASNPKLVHYLSAGSIQGLRPLRYEKRVARNRFIFFALILGLALLGLIAMLVRRQ